MRRWLVRWTSSVAVAAMLLTSREVGAQQRTEDFTLFGLAVAPPAVMTIGFDLAIIGSLASDGTVRRGLAINSLVFSLVTGVMSLAALATSQNNPGGARYTVPFCWTAIALTGASGALSVYAFTHPPKPPPVEVEPVETPRPLRPPPQRLDPGSRVEVVPFLGQTPAGSLTGGASLWVRW